MARKKGSLEKAELDGAGWFQKAMAYKFGRFDEGVWCIAGAFKGRGLLEVGMDINTAKKELIKLMDEAARNCDGTKLHLLADAVELQKLCGWHDPLRRFIFLMTEARFNFSEELASKMGKRGIEFPAMLAPKTAKEVQDSIRGFYPKDGLPTLKNIREVAHELGVTLVKAKPGALPGVPRKPIHRAKR